MLSGPAYPVTPSCYGISSDEGRVLHRWPGVEGAQNISSYRHDTHLTESSRGRGCCARAGTVFFSSDWSGRNTFVDRRGAFTGMAAETDDIDQLLGLSVQRSDALAALQAGPLRRARDGPRRLADDGPPYRPIPRRPRSRRTNVEGLPTDTPRRRRRRRDSPGPIEHGGRRPPGSVPP